MSDRRVHLPGKGFNERHYLWIMGRVGSRDFGAQHVLQHKQSCLVKLMRLLPCKNFTHRSSVQAAYYDCYILSVGDL